MITIYFAPPGVGKSTLIARFAFWEYVKQKIGISNYERVLCNYPVKHTYLFKKDDIGKYDLSDGQKPTLVLYDEGGLDFLNRNFKTMQSEKIEHFKLARKYREDYMIFSQAFDLDLTIKNLAPRLYLLKKCWFWPFTIKALRVKKSIIVKEDTHDLCDGFEFDPWYIRWLTTKRYYLPPYWGMFDSWDAPALPRKDFKRYD